jgi:hypothetical protein
VSWLGGRDEGSDVEGGVKAVGLNPVPTGAMAGLGRQVNEVEAASWLGGGIKAVATPEDEGSRQCQTWRD